MKFSYFIKDKILLIIMTILAIISIEILLLVYQIDFIPRLYTAVILIIVLGIAFFIEYRKKKSFYQELKNNLR